MSIREDATVASRPLLDPVEGTAEILFGLIMVLTFTSSIYLGAVGIFLLVFLSTLPVVVPFIVIDDLPTAQRTSNAIAALLLFATGWSLGRPGWRAGLGTVSIGLALVMIAIALGG